MKDDQDFSAREAPDLPDWRDYVQTPASRHVYARAVHVTSGEVLRANNLLAPNGAGARLTHPNGGIKPYAILDLGPAGYGGYPVFKVNTVEGRPVLRLAYANWLPWITDEAYGEIGGYVRRYDETYLGVELPALPANPYRHELYTITGPGIYAHPLIQGQQRWIRVQLDTPGTSVELDYVCIDHIQDTQPYAGHFICDDEDLNRLWYASTYTAQMASITKSQAWDTVRGWLAPRKLAHGPDMGLSAAGVTWRNYVFDFDALIRQNPDHVSGIGWAFRAVNEGNAYIGRVTLDGRLALLARVDGRDHVLSEVALPDPIVDSEVLHIRTVVQDETIVVYVDGTLVDLIRDQTFSRGRVGFCQAEEHWALVNHVRVRSSNDHILLSDDFTGDLGRWRFATGTPFVADGAGRDRLPWLGDLDWAAENAYYAFAHHPCMKGAIEIFARHQTPEGYTWATAYPESFVTPGSDDYGLWPSDEFSAWFVPIVANYLLFTNDKRTVSTVYDAVKRNLDYAWSHVGSDHLFVQRPETARGQGSEWDPESRRSERITYTNLLIYDALQRGAAIAQELGHPRDVFTFRQRAREIIHAIRARLWSTVTGDFVKQSGSNEFSYQANALALALEMPEHRYVPRIVTHLERGRASGKFRSLTARGQFIYGDDEGALATLRSPASHWIDILNDRRGVQGATWESCIYPPFRPPGEGYRDMSHPDTGVAHLLSGYVLGVRPTEPGFRRYSVVPHPGDLTGAAGVVPTPHGPIEVSWHKDRAAGALAIHLTGSSGTRGVIGLPKPAEAPFQITVNGVLVRDPDGRFHPVPHLVRGSEGDRHVYLYDFGAEPYTVELLER